jgi:hypothetical protein
MLVVIIQFALMGMNLYMAKVMKDQNRNPWFQYFVAGICFFGGVAAIIKLF